MFEENPPPGYPAGSSRPESSEEANTAASRASGDPEKAEPIPSDGSDRHPPADLGSSQHPGTLTALLARQKAEYEARIASLEQRNRELHSEVQGMHSQLGRQRQRHSLTEVKMRNAERAKEDAERRNKMLQKEMEEFFETFVEINKWK